MEPMGLSMNRLALDLRVPLRAVLRLCMKRRGVTADTALRLARYFNSGTLDESSVGLRLEVAQDKLARIIEREVRPASVAVSA
jgi:antitoxin HigA-1